MRTVKEILEEIAAKQATVFAIFKEAKTEDGQYDFSKVTSVSGTPEFRTICAACGSARSWCRATKSLACR